MKIAICYYSRHHGNTLKVLVTMAGERDIELIDVMTRTAVHLEEYDVIGFASGIYYSKFHETVLDFARRYLPRGKDVFFVYTSGSKGKNYTKAISGIAADKGAKILGEFGCRGFDTYGPFRLVGGIAKGHPDADELRAAEEFCRLVVCRER